MLRGEGLGARLGDLTGPPEPGVPSVTTALIPSGFTWESVRLAVLTEADLVGQHAGSRDARRMPSRRRGGIDPLQLTPGDYVVHEQHGVGRYQEMTSRSIQGAVREYLVIEYAPGKRGQPPDRLYVPTDQLDQVTRYVGGEMPSLHRLGGADWAKTKGRARKAVRQIASELIRLYSARMASPGHAFGPDSPWQRELEDAFPYIETADQLAAIDEVKQDMERPVPMDRLICGDVGYGKTEIAVRAAFKAVQDGSQVAVLVPTTLLAQQHQATFGERYAPFPVVVRTMSRFQSDAEVAETLRGLADGTVDVVIGTHRLLSPDTRFARLGLVILDEEQRFGVEHKEYLKRLRTEVDVLSMSATPIPRTLEMGVAGIREMSTILTPPEERHPVLTMVGPYDEKQIAAAIRRELLRDGQVFFVHNRVSSINKVAARVAELVPEARVVAAHGQMNEHMLERIMLEFLDRKHDVLVSTTIVESGLDIPNANTLIVDRADVYGLSQLHQLRGRVGRASERAYAYFLFPPEKPLTETAHERLATIAQHTEMGAGMYVALKDLEIRGAGQPARWGAVRPHRRGGLRPLRADDRRGSGRTARRRAGRAGGGPGGTAGQRAHPALLRAGGAAAARGVHPHRRHRLRCGHHGRHRGTDRPLRPAARPGARPARGGRPARAGPQGRADRHHPARHAHPVRAGGPAGIQAGSGAAALPEDGAEAGGAYDARTGAQGRTWRPPRSARPAGHSAPARQGATRLVRAAHRGGVRRERPGHAERLAHIGRDAVVPRTSIFVIAAAAAATCALSACGPVRMGAAAISGGERITTTTLSDQVSNLEQAYQAGKGIQLQFPQARAPQQVLSWLLRFQIRDELAARNHLVVTTGESQRALSLLARQTGRTGPAFVQLAVANGLAPDMLPDLGRYEAIQNEHVHPAERRDAATYPGPDPGPQPGVQPP